MNTVQLDVTGLGNTRQKTALKNALAKIPGVHHISVNPAESRVAVGYNRPADEEQIRQRVAGAGFTPV